MEELDFLTIPSGLHSATVIWFHVRSLIWWGVSLADVSSSHMCRALEIQDMVWCLSQRLSADITLAITLNGYYPMRNYIFPLQWIWLLICRVQ
jgi:hypothetical protein